MVNDLKDGLLDGLDASLITARADIVDFLLSAFQQQVGVLAGGRLAQNAAGGIDEAAGLVFLLDDLKIRIDIGDGRDGLGNAG